MRAAGERAGADAVADDVVDLARRVAELRERRRDGRVDDLEVAAAGQLLELHEREVGLDARRVAVHHEADRAGRRDQRDLGVAVAVRLAEGERAVGILARGRDQRALAGGRVERHRHDREALVLASAAPWAARRWLRITRSIASALRS